MKDNKKIIGVCLTKIEDEFRTDFLTSFHPIAEKNGYKTVVFNSPRDLYYGDSYDMGSKSIFEMINYDIIDHLVILDECFYDKSVPDLIIRKANEKNVPVVLVHGTHDGCVNIVTDYIDAYKTLIRHLFDVHGVKKPVFVGGRMTDDPHTEARLACFKEVLAEYGVPFSDDLVYYGDYWDQPTKVAARKIIARQDGIPDAIVCANDTMAVTVCEELAEKGYKVPEDIAVTGFDGLISAEYYTPRISTCQEDINDLAELVFSVISGDTICSSPETVTEKYIPFFSESCGCTQENKIDYRQRAAQLFRTNYDTRQHEGHVYKWVDSVLDSDNINTLSHALSDYILPNSCVCLSEKFIMTTLGQSNDRSREYSGSEFIVISSMSSDYGRGKQGRFPGSDMIPDIGEWLRERSICILTPVFVGEEPCGYYVLKTENITEMTLKLFRVSKTMNIAFGALLNKLQKSNMQSTMLNARFTDALTGLPNLKGFTKWFDEFSASEINHQKTVMVSVYNIPQYKFIFENYGMDDVEEAVKFTSDALRLANRDNGFIARTGNDEFIVFNYVDSESEVSTVIDNAVSVFFGVIEGYNTSSDKDYYLEVNCGCTVANAGWDSTMSSFIKLANAEMYMNKLKAGLTPVMKEERAQAPEKSKTPKDLYSEFTTLVEKNLFTYFFQPIIDAKTGDIYAYEALMRTSGGIKMSPLEILDIAKEYNMLYEIEKATMFNVMERYERDMEMFADAKVFINTIPGNFLSEKDLSELKGKYGRYMSHFVFEITEQDTVSDEELNAIRDLGNVDNSDTVTAEAGQIAVDDYGTGHSNIVNLLRYAPHVIKIDRFLITNIQNDPNKQMFVKSTIEFAKMNNIKVLAEGVETFEEMKTVIEFGVDLIQGYYTARPAPDPIGVIPENIRNEIMTENLSLTKMSGDLKVYYPHDSENVNLYDLALGNYGRIVLKGGSVVFTGTEGQTFEMEIKTEPGTETEITLENVCIKAIDEPAIQIAQDSKVVLRLVGKNTIEKNGIFVPANASLRITGDGSLDVSVKRNGSVGIGSLIDGRPFGEIVFAHTGSVSVELQIEKGVCIGGGVNSDNSAIRFESGKVSVTTQCVNSIGIGCFKGRADIRIMPEAEIHTKCSGKNVVSIGSFDGDVNIVSDGIVDAVSDGERCASLGSVGPGLSEIAINSGSVNAVVHSSKAVCIGAVDGSTRIEITGGYVNAYGEGDTICGYGSIEGIGTVFISGGTAAVKILSGCVIQFGGERCNTVITGGNVLAADESKVEAFNESGDALFPVHPGGDSFTRKIHTHSGEYVYTAEKAMSTDDLCVYIPQ
ncbi:MAG: EAL domain-containing protein [Ruminiclostridium sp.]|nr:EAL domain-containing protein [Ruminiclostridium sp.]